MNKILVFQSDFGLRDAAVSAMEGVSFSVDPTLNIRHNTHQISAYNIFEASVRMWQTINYWPEETVFVSVVDPGVGSDRMSVVAKTANNQYIVTPNNGTLTHVAEKIGIVEIRQIDESVNRVENSNESYTFHGRDVYAYTGAKLASNKISFEGVGPLVSLDELVLLESYGSKFNGDSVEGQIDVLDGIFGSLWSSINIDDFKRLGVKLGEYVEITINNKGVPCFTNRVKYGHSFADVPVGSMILYMNSINNMAVAINQGSFAKTYGIGVGTDWTITIKKVD